MYKLGLDQFLPFIVTIIAVLFSDLLKGIAIGMAVAIFYILRKNYRNNYRTEIQHEKGSENIVIQLSEEVSFLNKGSIQELLNSVGRNTILIIDGSKCSKIDHDVLEIIQDFKDHDAQEKNIQLTTINIPEVMVSGGH